MDRLEASCDLCRVTKVNDKLNEGFHVLLIQVVIKPDTQQLCGDEVNFFNS